MTFLPAEIGTAGDRGKHLTGKVDARRAREHGNMVLGGEEIGRFAFHPRPLPKRPGDEERHGGTLEVVSTDAETRFTFRKPPA